MTRKHWPNYISRTGSRFETRDRFVAASATVDTTAEKAKVAGVPLARIAQNIYACTRQELHTFVIGDSGCGKTRRVILPAIRLIAKTGESMVISDPKGELYKKTAKALEKKGYTVRVINFRNPGRGCRWNPLDRIDELYRTLDQENMDKAMLMFKDIVDIMKKDVESSKDAYWENSAAKFIMGVAYLIIEHGQKGDLTFENLAIVANEIFEMSETPRGKDKIKNYLAGLDKSSLIKQNLSGFIDAAQGTKSSIFGVAHTMLTAFTSQESLMDLFYQSDIDIDEIGKKKTALYIVLPDDSPALYSIATVLVTQIYSALVELADKQLDGVLPNRTVLLLDEFANFAKIPGVDSMLTAARSRGMRFVLVCQSMEQLHEKYGENGAEVLLSNCRTWLYMSCRNYEFLKRLENLGGQYISPYTKTQVPLIPVSDLQHFEMGTVLSLNDRCYPMIGYLPDYSEYDFGTDGIGEMSDLPQTRAYLKRNIKTFDRLIANALTVSERKKMKKVAEPKPVQTPADAKSAQGNAAPKGADAVATTKSASVRALLEKMDELLGNPSGTSETDSGASAPSDATAFWVPVAPPAEGGEQGGANGGTAPKDPFDWGDDDWS